MKRIIFLLLIFMFIANVAHAGYGLTGKDWRMMGAREKVSFVAGIKEGISITCQVGDAVGKKGLIEAMKRNVPLSASYEQQCKGLDKFYIDSRNLIIPVILALKIVKMELDGTPRGQIEELLAKMRTDYQKATGTLQ